MFTKGKSPEPTPPPQAPKPILPDPATKRAPLAARSGPSIISADVKMTGTIVSTGEIDINGQIEGDVRASALTVGETGAVKGEVIAESVVIRGTVEGRIRGRKVQLCTGVRGASSTPAGDRAQRDLRRRREHAQDPMADLTSSGS
jgi:hypothetical protein